MKSRTTIYLDMDLYEKAKKLAKEQNRSFSNWVTLIIKGEVDGKENREGMVN